ncbi:alpha-1,4-glucan--maltose-1-phosphate maltosyltransferase [Rhizobium oryzicola]|uniref:Alpha-1,4-glucan:maltose-1-phosphate maltosyltransferase n=1 Tax=Rhizobium oryzicola TaxID=1232668 RepID=A0ABT8T102_9HYPH|nr:alpha-1,4-glucan--maltose-1-phosphate maltosyltransferase [Rhizobium oryzicola]MDO1584402.1 alpha-1,4-glucan--maltose-1-phosphate maltosyltransferase [Rhizobium oryzicola]
MAIPAETLNTRPQPADAPRIYYVHPLLLRGQESWLAVFDHAARLGFDTILSAPLFVRGKGASIFVSRNRHHVEPGLGLGDTISEAIAPLAEQAQGRGLRLMLDLVLDRTASDEAEQPPVVADPRKSPEDRAAKPVDLQNDQQALEDWQRVVSELIAAGVSGFRCLGLERTPLEVWRTLIAQARQANADIEFLAWTPGTSFDLRRRLGDIGFNGTFSSLAWWDLDGRWFVEEYEIQRRLGYQITFPEAPFNKRVAHGTESLEVLQRRAQRTLQLSATLGEGLMIPMGFEFGATTPLDPTYGDGGGLRALAERGCYDLTETIRQTNRLIEKDSGTYYRAPLQLISTSKTPALALLRPEREDLRSSGRIRAVVVNRDVRRPTPAPLNALREAASAFLPLKDPATGDALPSGNLRLKPAELRIMEGANSPFVIGKVELPDAAAAAASPRLAIEKITPSVDEGRFAVKRVVGETVRVEADVFGDGHDPISASLSWRAADEDAWTEVPMQLVENDRWRAEFTPRRIGRHEFAVEGWRNPFAIFRYELSKKHEARLDLHLELQEGANLVRDAAEGTEPELAEQLRKLLQQLEESTPERKTELLLAPDTFALMARADQRPHRVRSTAMVLDAERKEAAFASWYELFPRSQSGDPNRHGTFDDVIRRLPAIKEMGFDVVYFPPIHPIGRTNRKGRNNTLQAGPNDPGSPYGIGSEAGGHEAIHPELGTFEDFRRLIAAASDQGMEIALDLAIQASPDHPWLKEHPGWFDWRPDGTIRYAENPPKKYEDIVNVDFYAKDAVPELWQTLRDIVQKWVDQGVKLFRVDNPHTKPFPFWEWLIADIRARHPDVVFLSEAFTRPKVMYRLAKIGFSQSYTYFTWRNSKWELETYMRELTTEAPRDFFRPHFFVNTHDINPDFLQNAPRPAYLIRTALAATLSGLWGIYNGFELCEGRPDAKRKEYADSEKYEIRAWDWDRPGNIKGEIALLNRLRKENPALHSHLGLTLLPAFNDNVLFFEKASAGRENVLLIAVNLDPHTVQEADVEIPLWSWNLPDHGSLDVEDLIGGAKFTLTGKRQRIRLDPAALPFFIWRIR